MLPGYKSHCATHQIRVILISCVVITSLFYPALDLYISSRSSSQSIVETLITPNYAPDYSDLVDLWSGYDTLRVHHDSRTRLQCRDGQTLRVERILIETHLVEDDAAANHQILLSTLDLESRLQRLITKSDSPCLKTANDQCLVISPLAFWNYDKESIRYDTNILDTLSYSKNVSVAGVPITPHMVLAGRASLEDGAGNWFDSARFLALTYFFPQNTCVRSGSESAQWAQLVQKAVPQNADVTVQVPESTLIALEYNPQRSESRKGWSAISAFLYIAYTGFTVYVVWSVRKMDSVHSRVGVTFTALVEIAVSTITSLSVCALVGFKITMVPWELLPIVIVFVGAENMFNLVDAVGKTSISLSVKQRIAEGLSRAGTSNTLKVVSYNAILGVIAVFSFGAVRQFCIFAIVVLVAHWFLAHTFFMAVLSIDVARLELEELLRHDQSLAQVAPQSHEDGRDQSAKQPRSGWQKLVFTLQSLLKGRAATNISLVMLLAIAATLYYTTYTTSPTITPPHVKHRGAVLRSKMREPAAQAAVVVSTAEQIWKTLNPRTDTLLHLRVELPTVITFSPDADSATSMLGYQARYTTLTFKFVLWLLTIVVLPIAATTSALWGLLLYLLKNTELLEAQRHRLDGDTPLNSHGKEDERTLQGNITFSTLPRAFASDVELIAASKDGRVVVSVGLHNEITVWNADTRKHVSINAEDILLRIANTSSCAVSTVTCVSVDEDGRYFAVGTGAGLIAGWSIDRGTGFVRALPVLALDNSSASVTEVRFVPTAPLAPYDSKIGIKRKKTPTPTHGRTPPPANSSATSEPNSPESKSRRGVTLLATYESGVAARWSIADFPTVSFFSPSRPSDATVVRALLMPVLPDDRVLVAFCLDDGTLDIVETGEYTPTMLAECILQAGDPLDLVTDTPWKDKQVASMPCAVRDLPLLRAITDGEPRRRLLG
ncbi:hypothetical protein NLJ89_g6771 [Agrocybe chaxingu]|uniref:Sterol regulatory element-binding protein cleavage-activating protein n=1 Tax=Agrocybe chaxingu TaxID=84603 RepID=A0A9W8MTS1_9AGAR|nr:hypothetical protein NLJ89_g6771 [Agrocybe chaxingu]